MFDGFIRDKAHWTPRAPAVVLPSGPISYARFDADINRLGGRLADLGIGPATGVVAIALESPYLRLAALCALARLGVASATAADPGADLRLTDRVIGPSVLAAPPRPLPALELEPDAIGRVMLSSGTTAVPKRVGMSWRRIEIGNFATLRTYGAGRTGTYIPITGVDTLLGFGQAVCAWSSGGAVAAGFTLSDLPAGLETLPPGVVGLTPRQLRALIDILPAGFRAQPQWRLCVAGALLPLPLAREAMARLTPDVRIIYGSTECSLIAVGHAMGLEDHPGQVGITPAGARVELVDDHGRTVPEGETGEIRIASERMTLGYLGDPAATAERFRDGWFHTRDLGRRLPDGRLVLEGRADDRLNLIGGAKVMPQQVEAAAFACEGVLDCAAFAVPDAADGFDRCWLAVVAAPGFDRDGLAAHLARRPDLPAPGLAWIDEIPRNAMGKVERSKLRDLLLAALQT
ncbi:class I adenylate-forming enzyme family protein [Phenylobacterium sp.]|uniref:class I adenylate-forming enzyme family protein n=1 Tax=Phenylobacterium sp. TaxID=1871053 RepID=UPI002EDA8178